jgi:hypothetical protein
MITNIYIFHIYRRNLEEKHILEKRFLLLHASKGEEKMRKRLTTGLALIATMMCLATLGMVSAGTNTENAEEVGADSVTFEVYIDYVGDYDAYWNDLYDYAPYDIDIFHLHLAVSCYIEVIIEDCCVMGDTIAMGKNARRYWSATSPDLVIVGGWLNPGDYTFYVGYIDCPGGFPAGYYWYVNSYAYAK